MDNAVIEYVVKFTSVGELTLLEINELQEMLEGKGYQVTSIRQYPLKAE